MKNIILSLLLVSASVVAEPLKIIVPFAPGGGGDQTARYLAKNLTDSGIETIVINKPSGGGTLALIETINSTDNKTLFLVGNGIAVAKPLEDEKVAEQFKKLTPVIHVSSFSNIIVASQQSGIKNWKQLETNLKEKKINMAGSSVASSMVITSLFADYKNTAFVSYNGDAKLLPDLLNGQIDVGNLTYISAAPHIEAGTIVPLALTMNHKFGNLPTLKEVGVNYSSEGFYGLMAGPAMPDSNKQEYYRAVSKILASKETHAFFKNLHAIVPKNHTPQDLAKLINTEQQNFSKITSK